MERNIKINMVQTAIWMAVLTLISKILGFSREMVLAGYFGTSYVVDAYVMSTTILTTLFGGIVIAISTAFMPIFSKTLEEKGLQAGNQFTSQIINILLVITIFASLIGVIFSKEIIQICAPKFQGEVAQLANFYIKIIFSYIIFYSISGILDSYLQYKNVFLPQIVSGYFISISVIISTIFSAYTSPYNLGFGLLIGYILKCLITYNYARKKDYQYFFVFKFKKHINEIMWLALPVFIGSYINYINLFIDKTLASGLKEGSIAALNYASLLNTMIIGVTATILSTIIYPKLTQASSKRQTNEFNELAQNGLILILLLGVPCSIGAFLYSDEIIQIVYERGAFDILATNLTAGAFMYYAIGMVFIASNEFIVKIYYAKKDMRTPMYFGIISVTINICLNLILIKQLEHRGLALATSIAAVTNFLLLLIGLKLKHSEVKLINSKMKIVKILLSSICAVGLSYVLYRFIVLTLKNIIYIRFMQLLIPILFAIIVYLGLLYFFKVDEVMILKLNKKGK